MRAKYDTYKRSIWKKDDRYSIKKDKLSGELLEKISWVQSIESAKKRTPPIPVQGIIDLLETVENMPDMEDAMPDDFEDFLGKVDNIWGCGFKTSICILSVLTKGQYPPLDVNVVKAAQRISQNASKNENQKISIQEAKVLNGTNREKLTKIYIEKLCPLWKQELLKNNNDPEKLDKLWFHEANQTLSDGGDI